MFPERQTVLLEVVGHEEYAQIEPTASKDQPDYHIVPGSRTAFLLLKSPDGTEIRAEIPHANLDPILMQLYSDYKGTD